MYAISELINIPVMWSPIHENNLPWFHLNTGRATVSLLFFCQITHIIQLPSYLTFICITGGHLLSAAAFQLRIIMSAAAVDIQITAERTKKVLQIYSFFLSV